MTNIKATKRALGSSVLALFLCFAMLLGTTFAWFTDSVTSANNVITAGNLDVNLHYWDNSMENGTSVAIEDEPDLKLLKNADGEEILWEPGASGFGTFKVANEGTLALKYRLVLAFYNATETAEGKTLADVLSVYALVRGAETGDDGKMEDANLNKLVTENMDSYVPGYEAQALKDFVLEGYLLPGESFTYELGVFWEPSDVDNDYNVEGGLTIDFGVTLLATQATYEKDSYGSDYDAEADMIDVILAEGGEIIMSGDYEEEMVVSKGADVTINLGGNALNNSLINKGNVTVNGGSINVHAAGFQTTGKATLENVTMNAGSAADYSNIANGEDAEATYDNVTINSAGGGVAAVNGAKVVFNGGRVDVNSASTSQRYLFYASGKGSTITINGGEFDFNKTQNQKRAYVYADADTTVYITGGTFGKASTRSGYTAGILGDGEVIITGGTFGFDPSAWVADGYKVVEDKTAKTWTVEPAATNNNELNDAIENDAIIVIGEGRYTLPTLSGKEGITIIGAADGSTVIGGETASTGFGGNFGKNTTIKNITFSGNSNGVRYSYAQGGTTVFENCTFAGDSTYGFHIDESNGATFIFNNCTFSGFNAFAADLEKVVFNNCTFLNNGNYGHTNIWSVGEFNNCTWGEGATFGPRSNAVIYIDGVRVIYSAEELAAALTADKKDISVLLMNDIDLPISSLGQITGGSGEYKLGGENTETITIDLNGKKLNITTTYWSNLGAKNDKATFTIKNGSMTSSQATGTWNSYDLTFSNCDYVIENVVFEKAVAFDNAGKKVTLKGVTINETHDYYALWITAAGQNVTIDGLTINSAGRGIKIDEQYVGTPAKVTLKVSNAKFTTASKAAIMVKSAAGADITVDNVDISNVAKDTTNVVWVDEDAATSAGLVNVTGGTKIVEA